MNGRHHLGATYLGDGRVQFLVWAPLVEEMKVELLAPRPRAVALARGERGYHYATVADVAPGTRYLYVLDGQKRRPDPTSRLQPDGVHEPSAIVDDQSFIWGDQEWHGLPLAQLIVYELHVGTYTPAGTLDAIIPHLDELSALGINAVELMPLAQFPGGRNWGYDGVYPFAVQNSYGGPQALQRLVDACHHKGLAVVLDVVYNHLGPEGNYLADFAPYFTDRYRTPWGTALNFDGRQSDEVRRFFVENALYWVTAFHIDALRLDAIHAIKDASARPFLQELARAVQQRAQELNRRVHLIAESDLNDPRVILPPVLGGHGMDAQWADDLHHALHALLTDERRGYYEDFGGVGDLAKALREGYVYTGQYSAYRQRHYGNAPRLNGASQFVVCSQNHDQIGNRLLGERLSQLVSFDSLKLAASVVLLSPFVPLLFMGEEYGETAPFQYFTSHADADLVAAVRRGRQAEFAAFRWQGEVPDPQAEATFQRCKLNHGLRAQGQHRVLLDYYRELIRLRRGLPPLAQLSKDTLAAAADEEARTLFVQRWTEDSAVFMAFNFGDAEAGVAVRLQGECWQKRLDSADEPWLGRGSLAPKMLQGEGTVKLRLQPQSCLVFARCEENEAL